MATQTEKFLAAKQYLRAHPSALAREPEAAVAEVAEYIGVSERDIPGLRVIREAIKDVQAGGHGAPHVTP